MSLTFDEVASMTQTKNYIAAVKKEKSALLTKCEFLLMVVNYKGKLDKKTHLLLPFKKQQEAIGAFKELKTKAKDVKKNQVALGTYTVDKESKIIDFEIIRGQAGPKKLKPAIKFASKLLSGYVINVALSDSYDGEGEQIDDTEDPNAEEDDSDLGEDVEVTPTTESDKNAQKAPAGLDPKITQMAGSINKDIKSLIDKTAGDAKAVAAKLRTDIPQFLDMLTQATAAIPKQIETFANTAREFLKKLGGAVDAKPQPNEANLTANQQKARALHKEIVALVKKIQELEKKAADAKAAKK